MSATRESRDPSTQAPDPTRKNRGPKVAGWVADIPIERIKTDDFTFQFRLGIQTS